MHTMPSQRKNNDTTVIDTHSDRTPLLSSDSTTNRTGADRSYSSNYSFYHSIGSKVCALVGVIVFQIICATQTGPFVTKLVKDLGGVFGGPQAGILENAIDTMSWIPFLIAYLILGCMILSDLLTVCRSSLTSFSREQTSGNQALESGLGGEERGHDFRDSRANQHNFFPLPNAPGRENANDEQPQPAESTRASTLPELRH